MTWFMVDITWIWEDIKYIDWIGEVNDTEDTCESFNPSLHTNHGTNIRWLLKTRYAHVNSKRGFRMNFKLATIVELNNIYLCIL